MSSSSERSAQALYNIDAIQKIDLIIDKIRKKQLQTVKDDRLPIEMTATANGQAERLAFLHQQTGNKFPFLSGREAFTDTSCLEGNVENYIGMTMVPTGVIGPVRVIGSSAGGDYFVPLATSEGALVASYHRGAKACYLSGGVTSICLIEGVQRSPLFKFEHIAALGTFVSWVLTQIDRFKTITGEHSRFAQLIDMKVNIEGNTLILTFEFQTGDASGQNMVTICTEAICQYILGHAPIQPVYWFIESNYSGDKKATAHSFMQVRGKKVTAEINIPESVIVQVLKSTPQAMAEYWRSSTIGIIQSGAIGAQGHYANGLAALFLATGQDVACVSEAATGITRMELNQDGSLYASVTLPNLIVGTVGGGTALPTQQECLELMECAGTGNARKFSEICGALVLAGEISIAAALSAGHFSAAHKKFGRKNH